MITKEVRVRLPEYLYEYLDATAERMGLSVEENILEILHEHCAKWDITAKYPHPAVVRQAKKIVEHQKKKAAERKEEDDDTTPTA